MISRILAALGGLLLVAVSILHYTGYADLQKVLSTVEITGFFGQAIPTIWLVFSWHLIVIAIPVLWSALFQPSWYVPALIFCSLVTLGDFFWVFSAVGWFPGTIALLGVVILLVFAAIMRIREQ